MYKSGVAFAGGALVLLAISPQADAGQRLPLTADTMVIQVQKKAKGCVGDRGAKYTGYSDCLKRRSRTMSPSSAASYCGRICSGG